MTTLEVREIANGEVPLDHEDMIFCRDAGIIADQLIDYDELGGVKNINSVLVNGVRTNSEANAIADDLNWIASNRYGFKAVTVDLTYNSVTLSNYAKKQDARSLPGLVIVQGISRHLKSKKEGLTTREEKVASDIGKLILNTSVCIISKNGELLLDAAAKSNPDEPGTAYSSNPNPFEKVKVYDFVGYLQPCAARKMLKDNGTSDDDARDYIANMLAAGNLTYSAICKKLDRKSTSAAAV